MAAATLYAVWTRDSFGTWSAGGSAYYRDREDAREMARYLRREGWDNGRRCVINEVLVVPVGETPSTVLARFGGRA